MAILKKILIWVTIFTSWPIYSAVLKHESAKLKVKDFSFSEFCETMKAKNATLISAVGMNQVECLNEKFNVIDFCFKKLTAINHITRGYANDKEKKVYCEEAQSVMVSISCDERDLTYCFDPKKGCEQLQKIYANRLEVVHYSLLEKNLNCYFAKPLGDSLDEK